MTIDSTASAESRTPEQTARWMLGCPAWCTLPTRRHDPEIDEEDGALLVWHTGRGFGMIGISASSRNNVCGEIEADLEGVVLSIDELRRAAADALAAAEWLERHTEGVS